LTRVVVEGGLFYAQQAFTPLGPLAQIFGSGPGMWLGPSSIVPASFIQGALMTDVRAFIMRNSTKARRASNKRAGALWPCPAMSPTRTRCARRWRVPPPNWGQSRC